jgi:hypothetical protein
MNKSRFNKLHFISTLFSFSVVAALIFISLLNCGDKKVVVETPPGILYGNVIDSLTSAPIVNAAVYPYNINSAPKYTDSTGYYAFPLMPVNGVNVTCLKPGYISKSAQCNIVSSESTRVDFQIAPITR